MSFLTEEEVKTEGKKPCGGCAKHGTKECCQNLVTLTGYSNREADAHEIFAGQEADLTGL